jgi:ABC-type transporter Mla subunit MlaD
VSTPDPFEQDDADAAAMAAFFDWVNESEPTVAELRERISTLEALTDQLAEALRDAMENMDGWASYASDYFRTKHNLSGDLAEIASALDAYEADKEAHR